MHNAVAIAEIVLLTLPILGFGILYSWMNHRDTCYYISEQTQDVLVSLLFWMIIWLILCVQPFTRYVK